jgi:phosphopentomutase
MKFDRVFLIIMDGCGAGSAPDAAEFGDFADNLGDTLVHTAKAVGGLKIPTLRDLGLGNALDLANEGPRPAPRGSFGRLQEASKGGKDTVTGHWEMMGIQVAERFPTYPQGFPADVIAAFEKAIGSPTLGNYASSGTVILKELGEKHLETGYPIVYTSADSVFQIACHEAKVPPEKLYEICRAARQLLHSPHNVQRVIARPFEGESADTFRRTEHRKDFPLSPPSNVLDALQAKGVFVAGVGVIPEVFDNRGFSFSRRTQSNVEHHRATMELLAQHSSGFFFVNFEDFDMLYGHRNDPRGFAGALEQFDTYMAELMGAMKPSDLLLISADHGNDPTTPSTDHAREYVPLLLYSPSLPGGRDYGIRPTMADLGATVAAALGAEAPTVGSSLLDG